MTAGTKGGSKRNDTSWGGVAKWIVLGVVMLAVLFLFRTELSRLLDRVTGMKISRTGIELKTAETPFGEAHVSNVPVTSKTDLIEGIHGTSYISRRYNFQISWPSGGQWAPSEKWREKIHRLPNLPPTVNVPVVIKRRMGEYSPNVSVAVILGIRDMSIGEYVNRNAQDIRRRGSKILSMSVDDLTQGGFLVYLSPVLGHTLYNLQRYAIAHGRAYVITASGLPPDNLLTQQLRGELLSIINSFQLIE